MVAVILGILLTAVVFPRAHAAIADEPFMARGFYASLEPDALRKLLAGRSLRGVSGETGSGGDDFVGFTPLMRAAGETPYPEVIDVLVEAGCDVNAVARPRWVIERNHPMQMDSYRQTAVTFALKNPVPAVLAAVLRHKPVAVTRGEEFIYGAVAGACFENRAEHLATIIRWEGFPRPDRREYLKHTYFWYNLVMNSSPEHRPRVEPAAATKMAKALVEAGYKAEYQVLVQALQTGQSGVAMQAIRSGVVPRGKDLLWTAFFRQPYDRDNHFPDPSPEIIAELLKHNDPNVGREAPILLACRLGVDVSLVKMLVEAGANIDPGVGPRTRATPGYMPSETLLRAVFGSARDNAPLVAYLLELGIYPDRTWDEPILLKAARLPVRKPESAMLLIKAGDDPAQLRQEDFGREFGQEIGVLDENGFVIQRYEPTEAFKRSRAYEKTLLNGWADRNRDEALLSRRFYRVADADDVRRVIGKSTLNRPFSEPRETDGPNYGIVHELFGIRRGRVVHMVDMYPLAQAAMATDDPDVIKVMGEAGADVNALGAYAVRCAFENRNPEVLAAILELKPDIRQGLDHHSWLREALPEHIDVLVRHGLDLNRDIPVALVYRALYHRNYPVLRRLLEQGADPDMPDEKEKERPLELCLGWDRYAHGVELIRAGADPVFENENGIPFNEIVRRWPPKNPDPAIREAYSAFARLVDAAYARKTDLAGS